MSVADILHRGRLEILANVRKEFQATLGPGCGSLIGWLSREPTPTRDVTQRFNELYGMFAAGATGPLSTLAGSRALMVPGLFAKHYATYMDDNVEGLATLGIRTDRAGINTDDSVETNADTLAEILHDYLGSPAIVVAHSKGCLDVAAALALHAEVRPAVRAAVFIQAPLGGSPIATDIEAAPELAALANSFIRHVLAGQPAAVSDLTYDKRRAFLERHSYPTSAVPTLCVASVCDAPLATTALAADYIELRYGVASDGLVCHADAGLPGARIATLQGLDHASSVLTGIPGIVSHYRPATLTRAAVAVALEE